MVWGYPVRVRGEPGREARVGSSLVAASVGQGSHVRSEPADSRTIPGIAVGGRLRQRRSSTRISARYAASAGNQRWTCCDFAISSVARNTSRGKWSAGFGLLFSHRGNQYVSVAETAANTDNQLERPS